MEREEAIKTLKKLEGTDLVPLARKFDVTISKTCEEIITEVRKIEDAFWTEDMKMDVHESD